MSKPDKLQEIRIYGVSPDLAKKLHNIAKYNGLTRGQFIKSKLREICDAYPPNVQTFEGD